MRIRAHNLLCIQGFVGKGYSPEFVANMTAVIDSLSRESEVTVVAEPDVLCEACPNLGAAGCTLHGEGTERGIVHQDREVLARLGLAEGARETWGEIVARIATRVEPEDLNEICGACPWLGLGVCAEGIGKLKNV